MCKKLEVLKENYNQSIQNFNWVDQTHVREAILNLSATEFQYFKEKEKLNTEGSKK
jgi:hypothetical protein